MYKTKGQGYSVEMKRLSMFGKFEEIGFASKNGLFFGQMEKTVKNGAEKYAFREKTDEYYLQEHVIRSLAEVGENKIIVCGLNSKLISIVDRNQRAVIKEIINPLPMGIEK